MSFSVHVFPDVIRDNSNVGSNFLRKEGSFLEMGSPEVEFSVY
jgi:hypothetical protein